MSSCICEVWLAETFKSFFLFLYANCKVNILRQLAYTVYDWYVAWNWDTLNVTSLKSTLPFKATGTSHRIESTTSQYPPI